MNAIERNKRLYEILMSFEDNDYSEEDTLDFLNKLAEKSKKGEISAREFMETSRFYSIIRVKRKYVEKIIFHNTEENKEQSYMQITEAGWDFIYNYQAIERENEEKERQNVRMRSLENAETKRGVQMVSLTRALVWATVFLGLGALVEVLKYLQIYPHCH